MKKILSFFLALTATVAVNATVVTFEFADPTTYGFVAPAQGAYTQVESGASIAKDNVTLVPTFPSDKNGMRFFSNSNTGVINLRGYVGTTLVITAPNNENIVSIAMSGSNLGSAYLTAESGSLNGSASAMTWTGSANAVTLNIIKSTVQFNQIVVTYGEDAPVIPDCDFDTLTVTQAIARIANNQLCACIVKGRVKSIITTDANIAQYGNVDMWIEDATNALDTLKAFRLDKGANSLKFTNRADLDATFAVGDVIYMYANALMNYNDTKAGTTYAEINTGYFFKKDGAVDPVVVPCVLDTVSVVDALALIANNDACPHVVKGVVSAISGVESYGAIKNLTLADAEHPESTILAYNTYAGPNKAQFTSESLLPFMVGDTIYVYGGALVNYQGNTPELSKEGEVYYIGREGVLNRVELDFDVVAVEEDFGQVVKFSKAGATSPAFEYEITLADDDALAGTYVVSNATLIYQDAPVIVNGSMEIVVDSIVGEEIYYSIILDLVDAKSTHYSQALGIFHSPDFLNDNPNVTAALAYEIGMALASGENTEATYNVYGFATGYYAKSKGAYQYWDATYKNHSFYISNVQGATRGFFEGYRVGPTSGNAADTAQFCDLIVFKGVQIKNYNGTIENNAAAKYDKVTSSTPVLRDVEAPEITVSEALTIESLTANYQMSKKYYTVCGLAADDADNNGTFHMAQGTDTIEAYKCVSPAGHAVKKGDNVKVRTLLECYNGKIQCYYGSVEGASVTGIEDVIRDSAVKAQKIVMDGQIVIVKEGILYNVLGIRLED